MRSEVLGFMLATAVALTSTAAGQARAQQDVLTARTLPEPVEDTFIPTCQTDIRLSGAVYNGGHPEQSFALVQFRSNTPSELVRVGSTFGAYELVAIEPRGVLLRSAAGECWLRLVGDPAVRAQRAAARPPRAVRVRKPDKRHKSDVAVIGHR